MSLVAVDDEQRHRAGRGGRTPGSHSGEGGANVVRGAVGDPRVHPDRRVQVWVGRGHDGGHGATGGKPGDVDASRIDEEIAHNLAGDASDDCRLARIGLLVRRGEPVPIATVISRPRLLWVGNEEGVLLGELVHPCAGRKVRSVLLAAVEHDHKRNGFTGVAHRNVEVVAASPGAIGVSEVADLTPWRGSSPRRCATARRPCASGPPGRADDVWQARQRSLEILNQTPAGGRGVSARLFSTVWHQPPKVAEIAERLRDSRFICRGGAGARQTPLQNLSGLGQPPGTREAQRLDDCHVRIEAHRTFLSRRSSARADRSVVGWTSGRRSGPPGSEGDHVVRAASAAFTACGARKAPRTSTRAIVATASSGETSSSMVASPRTRSSTMRPEARSCSSASRL